VLKSSKGLKTAAAVLCLVLVAGCALVLLSAQRNNSGLFSGRARRNECVPWQPLPLSLERRSKRGRERERDNSDDDDILPYYEHKRAVMSSAQFQEYVAKQRLKRKRRDSDEIEVFFSLLIFLCALSYYACCRPLSL
jgi:hypothetical protein